jgi:hypothetical protein
MDEETAEAFAALFESNFQQNARLEALEITLSALISNIASIYPLLPKQLPEMLEALANIRAAQLGEGGGNTTAFKEQIAKQQRMIRFVTAK